MSCRSLVAALGLAVSAVAAPPLSTIQDVLYKADGTRFNGTVTVAWKSFQPAGNSAIVAQGSTVVRVTNGYLQVQLVPSTSAVPVATYAVTYTSNGRTQFRETWVVPASTQTLRVRDVRIASSGAGASSGGAAADTSGTAVPLSETEVIGLSADLAARPVKGPNFSPGSVAVVDASGMISSVNGVLSDCVHVDGSSGPCGSSVLSFVDSEMLSGLVDGVNTSFGLSATPGPAASLSVYRNGVFQKAGQDYTLSGNTVQFVAASTPQPGDTLLASYRTAPNETSGGATAVSSAQVLCSGSGSSTNSATLATIGACTIGAGVLSPGDRVEIRFDLAHQNSAGGFSLELHWGGSTVLHRDAVAAETLVSGRADATILASTAQTSSQTWGNVLAFGATVGMASDVYAGGLTVTLLGSLAQSADTLAVSSFTVVRIP